MIHCCISDLDARREQAHRETHDQVTDAPPLLCRCLGTLEEEKASDLSLVLTLPLSQCL